MKHLLLCRECLMVALQLLGLTGLTQGPQKQHVRIQRLQQERKRARGEVREGKKTKKLSLHHRTALTEISARSHRVNHHLDHEQDLSKRMERKQMKGRKYGWNKWGRLAWGKQWCPWLKSMYINISYFLHWDCTGEIVKNSKEPQNKDGFPGWGTKRQQRPAHFMSFMAFS